MERARKKIMIHIEVALEIARGNFHFDPNFLYRVINMSRNVQCNCKSLDEKH